MIRGATRRYDSTLDGTLRSAVIPYGYTVTIWAAGAYLIGLRGLPGLLEAFAFVSGALIAFALLASYSQRRLEGRAGESSPDIHPETSHPIFAAGLHILAVGLALLAAWAVDETLGRGAWFFCSFAVTLIYLTLASLELAFAIEMRQREIGLRSSARRIVVIGRRGGRSAQPKSRR